MKKVPSDYKILGLIFEEYKSEFESFDKSKRNSKVYVPIDIDKISSRLGVDNDIVFGRLYYHCNEKYSYKKTDGSSVEFFANSLGSEDNRDAHCVQFPLVISVLADLGEKRRQFNTSTMIAIISAIIASLSLILSMLALGASS